MKRLLLGLMLLALPAIATAGPLTYRGESTLWADTLWSGEVLIDGIVTIAPEVTLTIAPGTIVRFTRFDSNADDIGEHELFIQGRLLAQGRAGEPIRFTSMETVPRAGDWGAINMMASQAENVLEHCEVEYAYRGFHAHFARARLQDSTFRYNRRGAQFQESDVTITDCRFIDNLNGLQFRDSTVTLQDSTVQGSYWGVRSVYSTVTMNGNRIEGNRVNGVNFRDSTVTLSANRMSGNRRGLYLQRSNGRIDGNDLSDNSEYGLFLEDAEVVVDGNRIRGNGRGGVRLLNGTPVLTSNDLSGNDLYALVNDGRTDLDLVGNAWGTTDPGVLAESIRDGGDRTGNGCVHLELPLATLPIVIP